MKNEIIRIETVTCYTEVMTPYSIVCLNFVIAKKISNNMEMHKEQKSIQKNVVN